MAYKQQSRKPGGGPQPGDILLVVHDFEARSPDELTLLKGEHISLVELDDGFGDGWFLGKHMTCGKTGLFPGVYTERLPGWSSAVHMSGPSVRTSLPAESETSQSRTPNPYLSNSSFLSPSHQETAFEPSKHESAGPDASANDVHALQQASLKTSETGRSPSPSRASAATIPNVPRNISQALAQSNSRQESPVMNATLSVIDEHITNLSTPRHSVAVHDPRPMNDTASEYSSNVDHRASYVAGPETDEEEDELLSEENVKTWSPRETAGYLRQMGVDDKHCDIFEEQEISGDVLLEMDQEFIYMKEYNFGLMGKRLKTWHKIRQFQEEVKGTRRNRNHSAPSAAAATSTADDLEASTGSSVTTIPRIPSLMEKAEANHRQSKIITSHADVHQEHIPRPLQTQSTTSSGSRSNIPTGSPLPPWRTSAQESPSRPSAASVREISHKRRHSSLDISTMAATETKGKTASIPHKFSSHRKQASFDRNWSMGSPPSSSLSDSLTKDISNPRSPNANVGGFNFNRPTSSQQAAVDLDRGYFSGPETGLPTGRIFLRKRDGASKSAHSRHSSFVGQPRLEVSTKSKHSQDGSANSMRDIVPAVTSPAAQAYHGKVPKGRFRSASARTAAVNPHPHIFSPTVTNLEGGQSPALPTPSPQLESDTSGTSSPFSPISSKASVRQKRFGLRAISDAVTGTEKASVSSPTSVPSSLKDTPVNSPSRTGSSTPSATSKSLDVDNAEVLSTVKDAAGHTGSSTIPGRGKTKTKKETSAYARGLEKKTPADQRVDCDYSGWMRKKSSSLMTTWKPRLFFLRGRRLSYYYSENDSEERGVIDISSHKVLRADQDPITNLHAAIIGSALTPVIQSAPATPKNTGASQSRGRTTTAATPFIFKLMPPKAGLSRAVQFTKPTIHYFQVENVQEGRKWMAALIKATIEYDPSFGLETTNKQKLISLSKARARRERPPALMGDEYAERVAAGPKSDETGLNIRGIGFIDLAIDDMRPDGVNGTLGKVASLEATRPRSRNRAASEAVPHQKADVQDPRS